MRRVVLLVLVVWMSACGGGHSGNTGDGPSIEELPQVAHDATCSFDVRCGLFASATDCDAYYRVVDDPSPAAAVEAGKTTYDASAAKACYDAIANGDCDSTTQSAREFPEACDHIFTGTAQMGDACTSNFECASANCANRTEGDCPAGTCGPAEVIAKAGESCAIHQCVPGTFCNADEVCSELEAQNAPCDFDSDCDYGLGCIGATTKNCLPVPHLGEACPDGECAEVNAVCNAQGTCVAVGLPGDACSFDVDCTNFGSCNTATSQCQGYPTLGQMCLSTCTGESFCDMTTMMCVAPLGNGATCSNSGQCASQFCNSVDQCADREVCI